ncbi:c-di-GMP-binding flagellar brake protein YcgR [Pseudomonas duriflava]|uniref:C-di-GMP-binding flagellar brake protein YcgR n=1 Tax=Pseudomonas duriflava TaxID=459528 RepID=A0A562QC05_9PSED|nr:flagellar brake protein [Pseudomonas duriflava]TWI53556.1 c-di-GMP-binding flagellar brake protein YcgR [Pseudomonas duriflava]
MSNAFNDEQGPQPPKLLKTAVEINAYLKLLLEARSPLRITFTELNRQYQSFLVEIDIQRGLIALDELIPSDGEKLLLKGERLRVDTAHEGVQISWECEKAGELSEINGSRGYWLPLPDQVVYHQRRNAFRVRLQLNRQPLAQLADLPGKKYLKGSLLDISATGCKIRIPDNATSLLAPADLLEQFSVELPGTAIQSAVEVRHVQYNEKLGCTEIGLRFYRMSGLTQRQIERFVYQLQRETRRLD